MGLVSVFFGTLPTVAVTFLALWSVYVVIQRRYFHSLSHIPGPALWSVSSLPVLYHQGVREGQLMHVLPRLHAKYGTVFSVKRYQALMLAPI